MDWKWFFTRVDGRIGRKQFWMGVILLGVASIILSLVIGSVLGVSIFGANMPGTDAKAVLANMERRSWVSLINFIILVWPIYALSIKRRHDRGAGGLLVLVYLAVSIVMILLQVMGLGYTTMQMGSMLIPAPSPLLWIGIAVGAVLGTYLLVVLGFLKGDDGDNAYGANPLVET